MVRYINNAIESKVQLLDSSSDPAESAVVNYIVYDEADTSFDTGTMTHVDNGIYTKSWTPDAAGEWTFECYSSSPKFRKSYVYHVQLTTAITKYAYKTYDAYDSIAPVLNTLHEVFDATGGVRLWSIVAEYQNTENDNKDVDCVITVDGNTYTYDASVTGQAGEDDEFAFAFVSADLGDAAWTLDLLLIGANNWEVPFMFQRNADNEQGIPLSGHSIKVELRMTDAVGTAPVLRWRAIYDVLEEV